MASQIQSINMPREKHHNDKILLIVKRVFAYALLVFITLLCVIPFYLLLVNCTHSNGDIQTKVNLWFGDYFVKNWKALMANKNLPVIKAFGNSTIISLCSATLCVYFSALTAYATHIYSFKFKKLITTFILAIMMIPTQVASLGLVVICMKFNITNNYLPLILPSIASPVVYFYMKQYLESVLPYETIEAARVDGASEIRIFHTIVLPMIKPALALQFIFSYVSSWNNYFVPAMLISKLNLKTLPLIIAGLKSSSPDTFDLGPIYVLMTVAVFPLLIVYLIFSRSIIKGLTAGAVKG